MSATYAWHIDHENTFEDEDEARPTWRAVDVSGPRDAPADLLAEAQDGHGLAFLLRDDDGIPYYRGWIVFADVRDYREPAQVLGRVDDTAAFGPLDDYGRPNAGATDILYRTGSGRSWQEL